MVTQNMLRTHERKWVISMKENPICDCFRTIQMTWTNQTTEIVPYVRTYAWVTIYSKYHALDILE